MKIALFSILYGLEINLCYLDDELTAKAEFNDYLPVAINAQSQCILYCFKCA